ncbi:MAG TPA: SiaB family protein kinase [Bacillota bacterium]|nr:SiaB family protein kinase [Bacillota bacterium]
MAGNCLLDIQKNLREKGLLISFTGRFTQGIIEELGEAVKKYLEAEDKPMNDVFHIFSIFIEQTQNIKNYCLSKREQPSFEQISNSCIVTIGKSEHGNSICSGNLIEKEDSERLLQALEEIRGLDKDGLKKLYKEKMRKDPSPDRLGAGLGLVEMARKSKFRLEYSMIPVDEHFSYFTLEAVV